MNKFTKLLTISLLSLVVLIPLSIFLSKSIFSTGSSYKCTVSKSNLSNTDESKKVMALKIESVKYPWGHGYDVFRFQDDLYASYDPNQYLMISNEDVFASQNQNNRLKTISFDRQTGNLISQEIFQSNNGVTSKEVLEGKCILM